MQQVEALEKETEGLKSKIQDLKQLCMDKGHAAMCNFRLSHIEEGKSAAPT